MANQIALLLHTRRGDDVLAGEEAHVVRDESGAGAAIGGVGFVMVGRGGLLTVSDLEQALAVRGSNSPPVSLVCLENTHNRAGGRVFPRSDVEAIRELAKARGLRLHLDGARLWNAAAAMGRSPEELAEGFDTVSVCYSKGLGAPVGSALCANRATIERARRYRKMLGGGMRQAGIVAAAALHALEHHRARLVDDHRAAARFAELLAVEKDLSLRVLPVETNIVVVDVPVSAERVRREAHRAGLLMHTMGPERLRAVTHLDVPPPSIDEAAARFLSAVRSVLHNPGAPA